MLPQGSSLFMIKLELKVSMTHNEQVLLQVWNLLIVLPGTAAH
jgi:hypothetical protein